MTHSYTGVEQVILGTEANSQTITLTKDANSMLAQDIDGETVAEFGGTLQTTQPMAVQYALVAPVSGADPGRELYVVDAGIFDRDALLSAVGLDGADRSDLVVIDTQRDGVQQIGAALREAGQVSALHVLSHGSAGALQIGETRLDTTSLDAHAGGLAGWSAFLTDDADILLYACDVAGNAAGVELVEELARLTGADVAASNDPTGSEVRGGDWDLEFMRGVIETRTLVQIGSAPAYQGLLAQVDVPADETKVTFTAANLLYRGPLAPQQADNAESGYSFLDKKSQAVNVISPGGVSRTFYFEATPELDANALQGSSLDGGGNANNFLDFTGYGKASTKLVFTIGATSNNNSTGLSVSADGVLVYPTIRQMQAIYGGKGTSANNGGGSNTFKFVD
ncbi:MAG: DUF4347 domain-containing protein, partial [Planctomycetes bacterium]|nr:DUF4347 domain-containing protein [Planctomycetota bacterium]